MIRRSEWEQISQLAWDLTVGAGNDQGDVDYDALKTKLGREPTQKEKSVFT
jgi:hypothetical protein